MERVSKDIWIYAEVKDGLPVPKCAELLAKAQEFKERDASSRLCAVLLGWKLDKALEMLRQYGADVIYCADHEGLRNYRLTAYSEIIAETAEAYCPNIFLFNASTQGSELAATVAAKLRTGAAAHCIDVQPDESGNMICMVPAFGGKVVSEILIPRHRPQIASLSAGSLPKAALPPCSDTKIIEMSTAALQKDLGEEILSVEPIPPSGGVALENAQIVLCAGRGAADPQTMSHLYALAERLGAAVGCTRSFLDENDSLDERSMIGVSGKSVQPQLYMSFGVSGASQHICGIGKSRYIVSVDRDSESKMFGHSDFGVVGDADRVLCALLKLLEH